MFSNVKYLQKCYKSNLTLDKIVEHAQKDKQLAKSDLWNVMALSFLVQRRHKDIASVKFAGPEAHSNLKLLADSYYLSSLLTVKMSAVDNRNANGMYKNNPLELLMIIYCFG